MIFKLYFSRILSKDKIKNYEVDKHITYSKNTSQIGLADILLYA